MLFRAFKGFYKRKTEKRERERERERERARERATRARAGTRARERAREREREQERERLGQNGIPSHYSLSLISFGLTVCLCVCPGSEAAR